MNRSEQELVDLISFFMHMCSLRKNESNYGLCLELGNILLENCRETLNSSPRFKDVSFPTSPKTSISLGGEVIYQESMIFLFLYFFI